MTDEQDKYGKQDVMALDKEIEDTIAQIILACGVRPLKEKISLLYLTIEYIFAHNAGIAPLFTDTITFH